MYRIFSYHMRALYNNCDLFSILFARRWRRRRRRRRRRFSNLSRQHFLDDILQTPRDQCQIFIQFGDSRSCCTWCHDGSYGSTDGWADVTSHEVSEYSQKGLSSPLSRPNSNVIVLAADSIWSLISRCKIYYCIRFNLRSHLKEIEIDGDGDSCQPVSLALRHVKNRGSVISEQEEAWWLVSTSGGEKPFVFFLTVSAFHIIRVRDCRGARETSQSQNSYNVVMESLPKTTTAGLKTSKPPQTLSKVGIILLVVGDRSSHMLMTSMIDCLGSGAQCAKFSSPSFPFLHYSPRHYIRRDMHVCVI